MAELSVGPYEHLPAICDDYDPRAVKVARLVAEMITTHFPAAMVEHVGSTSVPGSLTGESHGQEMPGRTA
jgi:GrpB-like predicted nucleotidyltransferase (UPF0157 family)